MTDTFTLNLDGEKAWTGSVILNPGTHPVTVTEEQVDTSGDHPVVMLQLEAIGGDEPGAEVRDWLHYTPNTKGRFVQIMEAFGVDVPSGDFDWIPVKGRNCKVVVRQEPRRDDPEKMRTVVKAYQRLVDDSDLAAVTKAFDATPVKDDDVPF